MGAVAGQSGALHVRLIAGTVSLRDLALARVAEACGTGGAADPELKPLARIAADVSQSGHSLAQSVADCLRHPAIADVRLARLAARLELTRVELLAIALAAAVEDDPVVGRLLARLQSPIGGSRPTLGLIVRAFATEQEPGLELLSSLLNGRAMKTGLLTPLNDAAPIPERALAVPPPLCLAIAGHDAEWPGLGIDLDDREAVALPECTVEQARAHAAALQRDPARTLVLRTASAAEGRSVALAVATALGTRPVFIESEKLAGVGPWLLLRKLTPVFCCELAPGERRRLPDLPGYDGPRLVVCGPDGWIEASRGVAATWTLPIPSEEDRRALWNAVLGSSAGVTAPELAAALAGDHRHGAGRIAHLGRLAKHHAALAGHAAPERDDVAAAAWTGEGAGLDALAEPLRVGIPDAALVATPRLRDELNALVLRCRRRETLTDRLGVSARTRYRPGVRALFVGPSGTGKTLAAGWIATRLNVPLYRVDLASVTSKYIGDTEKNLAQLLARAEQSEVILLFDEADSLFGRRTDISDANDRFANAQTNYLLQRIENYDGIVLLTSNSQARFDDAFARRLDVVIEFPPPGPEERRALWQSHLGPHAQLLPADLNRLSVLLDLNGGSIRNVVLAAAVHARNDARDVGLDDVLAGLEAELRKLGRQVPIDLQRRR